ncbi:MAG: TonB-dependent siderophore receptor [Pseudomonadota bacterium]
MPNLTLARRCGSAALALLLVLTFSLGSARNAYSREASAGATNEFRIPAGSLVDALAAFERQSGVKVFLPGPLGSDVAIAAVEGRQSDQATLEQLLLGTGLRAVPTSGGYRIEAIEELLVFGTRAARYEALTASSVTGTDASLFDTARSIQVIPEQIILDQEATDLREVLRNVSGVQARNESGGATDSFIIRGFETVNIWRDGLQISRNSQRLQTANIEQVEVVKGPDALLSGTSSPGGRINVVTKLPKADPRRTVSATFDEYGRQELMLDVTGPLNSDGSLLYRFVGFTEDSELFRETDRAAEVRRDLIAPSLTWLIDEKNRISAAFEYSEGELPFDEGMVVVGDTDGNLAIPDIDTRIRFGEAEDRNNTDSYTLRLDYEHRFNERWQLDADLNYQKTQTQSFANLPIGGLNDVASGLFPPGFLDSFPFVTTLLINSLLDPSTLTSTFVPESGTLARGAQLFDNENRRLLGNLQLSGRFPLGATEHNVVAGVNYINREFEATGSSAFVSASEAGAGVIPGFPSLPMGSVVPNSSGFNIFDPVYGLPGSSLAEQAPNIDNENESSQLGFYVQDRVTIGDSWILTAGLRQDTFDATFESTQFFTPLPGTGGVVLLPIPASSSREDDDDSALSINAGVMFRPTEEVSLFASYSESFQPNNASTNRVTGAQVLLDPRDGEQFELGVKGSFWNDKLFFNLAWYDITLTNVPFGEDALTGVAQLDGEQESRGVELDASVQFFDGLSLIFNYARTIDAQVTRGVNEGNRIRQTPENSGSVWATYEFTDGLLSGLGLGGGATYVGDRFTSSRNIFELESYTVVDLTAFYYLPVSQRSQLRFQLGVKNLMDEEYFTPNNGTLSLGVGQPRTIFGSVGYEF